MGEKFRDNENVSKGRYHASFSFYYSVLWFTDSGMSQLKDLTNTTDTAELPHSPTPTLTGKPTNTAKTSGNPQPLLLFGKLDDAFNVTLNATILC